MDSENFQCQICQKKYLSKQSLYNHRWIKHKNEKTPISTKFDIPATLLIIPETTKINNNIKKYHCKYCDKTYNQRQGRHRHQLVCNNEHAIAIKLLNEKKKLYNEIKSKFNSNMCKYKKITDKIKNNDKYYHKKLQIIKEYYDELNKLDNLYNKPGNIYNLARLFNVYDIGKLDEAYTLINDTSDDIITTDINPNEELIKPLEKNTSEENSSALIKQKKYVKNKIPKLLKNQSWDVYIGKEKGVGNCYCCNAEIDSKHFECGHIIPASKGGPETIENLRPICSLCNKSIGTKHMDEFIEKYIKIKKPIENL